MLIWRIWEGGAGHFRVLSIFPTNIRLRFFKYLGTVGENIQLRFKLDYDG